MAPLDHPTVPICTENYLLGEPTGPNPEETGWKDTVKMNPGEVTVIKVRFSPVDGSKNYSFDPTEGPGYVWHCHILDHEDNEMMRPYVVVSAPKPDCE
jgi:FtsP/CotA-like multicopper oxidase with cupredoxin domain